MLTLTAAGCDAGPFSRDYARTVPNSAIQVGDNRDKTWEYVDRDGESRKLNQCEDLSPWNVAYRCTSPDGSVELTYNASKYGTRKPVLRVGDQEVPLYCATDGIWGEPLRYCIPLSDPAVPPQPVPRKDKG